MPKIKLNRRFLIIVGLIAAGPAITLSVVCQAAAFGLSAETGVKLTKALLGDSMPAISAVSQSEPLSPATISHALLGFDITDPKSILSSQVLAFNSADPPTPSSSIYAVHESEPQPTEAPPQGETGTIIETTISPTSNSGYLETHGVLIKNSTTYEVDPEASYNEPLRYDKSLKGPRVLITHSHTTEAYKRTDSTVYNTAESTRSRDPKLNVVRVGAEIAGVLNQAGIETIHDTKLHDYPDYNTSYKDGLSTVEEYLVKYPGIQIVLDIHRDSISRGSNTIVKTVADLDGKKAAQIMIVTGTDQGGLKHPNWRHNLSFAVKLQNQINSLAPSLCRPIDLRKERFNMHTTGNSLILEMGSDGNTLDEAVRAGRVAATALVNLLKK